MKQTKRFYTSDMHFDDDRFDILVRPFKNLEEQHAIIIKNWNSVVGKEDEVFVVGDASVTDKGLQYMDQLNGKKTLILGNYDDLRDKNILISKFDAIYPKDALIIIAGRTFYLNHYPAKASQDHFNLVGHVHGVWRVQSNMINVSQEVWNYTPVSEQQILNCLNAIENHFDANVFAGTLDANRKMEVLYTGDDLKKIKGPSVFLAGPTPRDANTESWRPALINKLREAGFKGTVITPETEVFKDEYDYDAQVEWEDSGLNKSSLIAFWVPRELKSMPGFTTNIEFGEWMKSGKVILGNPPNAEKMNYLRYKARKFNIPTFDSVESMCEHIIKVLN